MGRIGQRRAGARAAMATVLVFAMGGCLSTPRGPTSAADSAPTTLAIANVAERYIPTEEFQRISEFLTGNENKSGRIIERTHADQRTGFYFILDLSWKPGAILPKGTKARLEYIRNDDPVPKTADFVFPNEAGTWPEIFLGLTGADWPNKDLHIVAYKITLTSPEGVVLASKQSFLWELPGPVAAAATPPSPPRSN